MADSAEPPAYWAPRSGETYPLAVPRWRSDSGAPLLVTAGSGITHDGIDRQAPGLWRYRGALPVTVETPIALGEGRTPLVRREYAGGKPGFKLEWFSPTGSFKDRGAAVMLSALRAQGIQHVIEDSSGNGGAAIACYAAAGGLSATIYAPATTSPAKLVQARAFEATVDLVEGPREAAQSAAIAAAERGEGFYASHNWQALFLEGTKTLAYELWEDLGYRAPDAVVMPVGAGSLLLGCALGFRELLRAGQISRLPRLYAVQPENCSPLDAGFRAAIGSGENSVQSRQVKPTIAEGAAVRSPIRMAELIEAVRESHGATLAISESGIVEAWRSLASMGLFAEPTSALAAAGYSRWLASGEIGREEEVAVVLTGSGLKASQAAAEHFGQ